MPLDPPISLLSEAEVEVVVEVMRTAGDLGRAERELRLRFPQWDLPRRLSALRQGQNQIIRAWEKSPARKRRAALTQGHGPEEHKENR